MNFNNIYCQSFIKYFKRLNNKENKITITSLSTEEKDYLQNIVKTIIANQLWSKEGYYKVSCQGDKYIKKAMEALQ